jgi:predicted secreted Zn-dependent protease
MECTARATGSAMASQTRTIPALSVCLAVAVTAASAQSQPPIAESTYAVSGTTGLELYTSISKNGPNGGGHVAQTKFKLTWKRLFDERGGSCYLVHAKPQLSINQTYPKPKNRLSADMQRRWDKFMRAAREHEHTHARMVAEMVRTTEAALAGSFEANDRTCAKVKKSVAAKIDQGYQAHRERSRAFDKQELSFGGRMLVVLEDLVNER